MKVTAPSVECWVKDTSLERTWEGPVVKRNKLGCVEVRNFSHQRRHYQGEKGGHGEKGDMWTKGSCADCVTCPRVSEPQATQ